MTKNIIITTRFQNPESQRVGLEMLAKVLESRKLEYGGNIVEFSNPFDLIARLNPESPDYKARYIYIYTGVISSYNIGSWCQTLNMFDTQPNHPAFYFYNKSLPGQGISSGCNNNFDIQHPAFEHELRTTIDRWMDK